MRSKRVIRLTSQQARRMLRVVPPRRTKGACQARVSPEIWNQIDAIRRSVSAVKPWLMVPGLHIRLTGQLPSGKNLQGIRTEMKPEVTPDGYVVEVPRVRKHSRQRFAQWRDERLKELVPQLRPWTGLLPLAVPMMMHVWYWPSDRRVRDRSGMLDGIFHLLERAGIIADDGLVEDPLWHTMELDRQSPRVKLIVCPFVWEGHDLHVEAGTSVPGCPCCTLPQAS